MRYRWRGYVLICGYVLLESLWCVVLYCVYLNEIRHVVVGDVKRRVQKIVHSTLTYGMQVCMHAQGTQLA